MANVITWVVAHQALVAGAGVAVIDFFFAINPALEANGILHQVYTFLVGKKAPIA